jgi:signal transduction histidine kinase
MASFAELLEHTYASQLDERARGYIHSVSDAAHRMRALITDVLDYARIGKFDAEMAPVDLAALLDHVVADLDAGAFVTHGPLPVVVGHGERLAVVLQNLVSNAIKYHAPHKDPEIRVTAAREGSEWVIAVHDDGIGFAPDLAARILRPFQRLHSKEQYPGSGLGLASARKIVELHGGKLWASSTPGEGSTFFFSLPERQ